MISPVSKPAAVAALVLALAGFVAVAGWLFLLRFASGTDYPAYSSLRADPLGCRALFDSLERMSGLTVTRNFDPVDADRFPARGVLFRIGETRWTWAEDEEEILDWVRAGGRVVMTLQPVTGTNRLLMGWGDDDDAESTNRTERARRRRATSPGHTNAPPRGRSLFEVPESGRFGEALGFELAFAALPDPGEAKGRWEKGVFVAAPEREVERDPGAVGWYSTAYLRRLDRAWTVWLRRDGLPVLAERPLGRGSVAVATDSYFLSNEALAREPHGRLVAALVADRRAIVFDEIHHGITREPSVMQLAWKYGLHGVILTLAVLAGLYIWRSAVSLVPPRADPARDEGVVAGREAHEGFVNLLRRSIAKRDLIRVCLDEWRHATVGDPRWASAAPELEAIVRERGPANRPADIAALYGDLSRKLKERKWSHAGRI